MKFKNTYIMALILAALGAYVYFYEIQGEQARVERQNALKKIFTVEKDSITSIWLRQKDETIALRKDAGKWYISEPVEDVADRFVPDGLAGHIAGTDSNDVVSVSGGNPEEYGLNPPECVLTFKTTEGITDSIRIGSENITKSFRFAQRKPGSPIFLATNTIGTYAVDKSIFDFREREVFHYPRREINRYRLTNKHGTFNMQKAGEESWRMTEPMDTMVDQEAFDKLINQILKTRAEKFVDIKNPDLGKYGLANPAITWEIWIGDENAYRKFTVGKRASDEDAGGSFFVRFYSKDEGRSTIFVIDSVLVNTFDVDLQTLRSKKVAFFARDNVKRIKFDYADSAFLCEKDSAESWRLTEPAAMALKSWKINGALSDLESTEAVEFLQYNENAAASYGVTKSPVRIMLYDEQNNVIGQYAFGGIKGENRYFLDEKNEKLYLVAGSRLDNFRFSQNDIAESEPQAAVTNSNE